METAESLIDARGGSNDGIELVVRCVNDATCFVALPLSVVSALSRANPKIPLPLALTRIERDARNERRPHPPSFVAWAGARGSDGFIEISLGLADCLGLTDGQFVRVSGRPSAPVATTADLEPETERDWDAVLAASREIENGALRQIGVIAEFQTFPFWPSPDASKRSGPLRLRATKITPRAPDGVARLGLETELRIAPWTPTRTPSDDHRQTSEPSRDAPREETAAAVPCMLRVQSSRGVVVAWPRRLRRGRSEEAEAAEEAEVAVAPTSAAFVSRRTSEALELRDGAVVVVRVVGANAHSRPNDAETTSATLRVVVVENAAVSDGHVILTRALREALGAGVGCRVLATETDVSSSSSSSSSVEPAREDEREEDAVSDPRMRGCTARATTNLIRLRPVLSTRASSASSPPSASPPAPPGTSLLGGMDRAHLAALGLSPYADSASTAAGVSSFLENWVRTQKRFYGTNGFVPVVTGTAVRCRVDRRGRSGIRGSVSFLLEVRGSGNAAIAALDPDADPGGFAATTRCELGNPIFSDVSREAVSSNPAARASRGVHTSFSKLFGDAVRVDPPLGSDSESESESELELEPEPELELELEARLGASAVREMDAATSRLASTLRFAAPADGALDDSPSTAGVLFWGPPGCGKSAAGRRAARRLRDHPEVRASAVFVDCASIQTHGDSRPAMAALRFAATEASKRAPSVVFLDDLDVLAPRGGEENAGGEGFGAAPFFGTAVGECLGDLMDASSGAGNVAWIATCRSPESVSRACLLAGRLDHVAELEAPAAPEGRAARLRAAARLRGTPAEASCDVERVAEDAEGYVTSDLDALVERAASAAANRWFETASSREALIAKLETSDLFAARSGFVAAPDRALEGGGGALSDRDARGRLEPTLDSVGGLAAAKASLDEALSLPSRHPEIFAQSPLRLRTGVLLYGPPGCGKTLLARAAAASSGTRLITVKGPELLNKYIGQSEAGVREAFRRASSAKPCCLFFDEFDAIAPRRGHDTTGVTDRVVNAFLTELDGVEGLRGVVVVAATSRPDLIDPALLRPGRLDRLLPCPFPDARERLEILNAVAGHADDADDPLGFREVAAKTAGFSGADLRGVLSDAALLAERRGTHAAATRLDVLQALGNARASVSVNERRRLENVYAAFRGETGGGSPGLGQGANARAKRIAHA
jgi:peroxin-1